MIKVFVLFCSPHKNGRTRRMLIEFLKTIKYDEISEFGAYDINAAACTDCGYCRINNGCKFHDLDHLYAALEAADILIFAAPLYFLSFPAPAKAVIDRMQIYYYKRFLRGMNPPIEKRKTTIGIISYESEKYGGASHIKEQIKMLCTILNSSQPTFITSK